MDNFTSKIPIISTIFKKGLSYGRLFIKYELKGSEIVLKCQHCGFENLDQATYCSGCGQLLEQIVSSDVKSQTFEKKNRWILFSIIGVLVLVLIGGGIWFILQPNKLEVAQAAYQANDIAAYYDAKKDLSAKEKEELENYLLEDAHAVLESFKADGLYYKEAIRKLERIKSYLTQVAPLQEIQNQVETLHQSREAYEQGKAWVEAKEWNNARECFESVIESDSNYASARRYLDSILRWQLQEIGAEAANYFEQGDYEQALESIEFGLELAPDNEILLNLKQNIETLLNQPPVEEEVAEDEPVEFGGKLNSMIQSGLEALGDGIKSFFNGSLFGN